MKIALILLGMNMRIKPWHEHENCWHFNIYEQDKFPAQQS